MTLPLLMLSLAAVAGHTAIPMGPGPAKIPTEGQAISGLCLLSRPAVFAHSKVGEAATLRLKTLASEAQAEIDTQRKQLDQDRQAFQAQAATLNAAERQKQAQSIAGRAQALEAKAALRAREIEATREKALARIAVEMQPVTQQLYQSHGCGLLLDRNAVILGNMSNDLTQAVIQGLDARISTINFDRETLSEDSKPASPKS